MFKTPRRNPIQSTSVAEGIAEGIGEKADVQASTSAYHPKLTVTEAACRQPGIAMALNRSAIGFGRCIEGR
jgi:hypothetical protein